MSAAWVALVLTAVDGGPAAAQDVVARSSAHVELFAAVTEVHEGGCRMFTDAPRVKTRCMTSPLPPDAEVTWYKVESARAAYDNVPGGRFRFAPIDYVASRWRSGPRAPADVTPVSRAGVRGAGTMRYRVEVGWPDGRRMRSPGLVTRPGGPRRDEDIRKVTLRLDDSYVGYMSELAGLPYVFGSAARGDEPHQAERRVGVDCADLMVYGLRRLGHAVGYRSSRSLGPVSRRVAAPVTARRGGVYEARGRPVPVGPRGVRPGDWLIFDGHVAAFVEDRGVRGRLDPRDLVIHIAWRELAVESLEESGYGARPFEIRRPNALAPVGSN